MRVLAHEGIDILRDTLVGVIGRTVIAKLQMVIGIVAEPAGHIAPCQPISPTDLEHLAQIDPVDRGNDINCGKHAEAAELPPEIREIIVLQRVVEQRIPVIEEHHDVNDAKVERDHNGEQKAREAALSRRPVRACDGPEFEEGRLHEY